MVHWGRWFGRSRAAPSAAVAATVLAVFAGASGCRPAASHPAGQVGASGAFAPAPPAPVVVLAWVELGPDALAGLGPAAASGSRPAVGPVGVTVAALSGDLILEGLAVDGRLEARTRLAVVVVRAGAGIPLHGTAVFRTGAAGLSLGGPLPALPWLKVSRPARSGAVLVTIAGVRRWVGPGESLALALGPSAGLRLANLGPWEAARIRVAAGGGG